MTLPIPIPIREVKEALLNGKSLELAIFIECPHCTGCGEYPVHREGGPYGIDFDGLEACRRCYMRSGKQLRTVNFKELVKLIREVPSDG